MRVDGLVPDWPAPAGVRALFTTREPGVSAAPFDRFNLGDHVGDDPAAVAANRAHLAQQIGQRPVFLRQVHGTEVLALQADTPDGSTADAAWTDRRDVACVVMVADCLPVLFCTEDGSRVAAAHAGWRGLAGVAPTGQVSTISAAASDADHRAGQHGVLDTTVAALGSGPTLMAWLGPCIGPQAFEVGPEVRESFVRADAQAASAFVPAAREGHFRADLAALARQRLRALGVGRIYGNDGSADWCTVTQSSRFFSHRRDASRLGSTGRMAACIWLG